MSEIFLQLQKVLRPDKTPTTFCTVAHLAHFYPCDLNTGSILVDNFDSLRLTYPLGFDFSIFFLFCSLMYTFIPICSKPFFQLDGSSGPIWGVSNKNLNICPSHPTPAEAEMFFFLSLGRLQGVAKKLHKDQLVSKLLKWISLPALTNLLG